MIFSANSTGLPLDERADWLARQVAAGSTHIVMMPGSGAPGYPGLVPPAMLIDKPAQFREQVDEVLHTSGATGEACVPVIFLDEGGANPRERIDRFWGPLLDGLQDVLDQCLIVPGWELVAASEWTSADLSYALGRLHGWGVPHLWVHLSSGRWAMSSNPVEPDDPWQGAEADCWNTHGGEFVEGFLYQSPAIRDGDQADCDPADDRCWLNRLDDGLVRMGTGLNGWRVMPICYFEGPAYWYTRGQCSDAQVHAAADAAQARARHFGLTIGFGNGQPSA